MSERIEGRSSLLITAKNILHDRVVYPISSRGYEHLQRSIGEGIRESGLTLPRAVDSVYDRMGARFQLEVEDDHTAETIRHGAGIFVGNNQDYGANFLYLRALRDRPTDDISFFEKAASVPYWDASIQPHILPVYYDIPLDDASGYLAEKLRRSPAYEEVQQLTVEEKRQRNQKTLQEAAARVASNGIVTIFPSQGGDEEADWKRGIGDIVQALGEQSPDAQLIMGYTQGTSKWDKYRLAPGIRAVKPVAVTMHIKAMNMRSLLEGLSADADSKTKAAHLRKAYVSWVDRKKSEIKSASRHGSKGRW